MGPLSHYALLRAASRSGVEPLVGIGWAVPGLNGATRGHGDAASLVVKNRKRIPGTTSDSDVRHVVSTRIAEHELDNARLHEPLLQIRMGFLVRAHPPNVAHPGTTRDDWPPPSLADQELLKETTEALHKEVRDYFRVQKPAFHANVAPPVYKFFANWLSPPHSVWDFCVSLWDPEVMTARVPRFWYPRHL
jgi:hypothetical protein